MFSKLLGRNRNLRNPKKSGSLLRPKIEFTTHTGLMKAFTYFEHVSPLMRDAHNTLFDYSEGSRYSCYRMPEFQH